VSWCAEDSRLHPIDCWKLRARYWVQLQVVKKVKGMQGLLLVECMQGLLLVESMQELLLVEFNDRGSDLELLSFGHKLCFDLI